MVDDRSTQSTQRARPVADLPTEAAVARQDELARSWVIALIRARPFAEVGDVPVHELALEAPALCAQMVRAVQSDTELDRLTGRGAAKAREGSALARGISAIAGARDASETVEAVEALRGVLWDVLLDELREPTARQVGDLADRLAYVCAAASAAAAAAAPYLRASSDESAAALPGREPSVREAARAPSSAPQATIVDERVHPPGSEHGPPVVSLPAPEPEIEIRDVRGVIGPVAWIRSIGAQLERFERDQLPFAVLLVELVEIERLSRGAPAEGPAGSIEHVERALAKALGASGSLTRERPGRYWLLRADTDRGVAGQLAERLAEAVRSCSSDRATPLDVAIGTAMCPEDGREAAALAAHADVGLYADRSAVRAAGGRIGAGHESA